MQVTDEMVRTSWIPIWQSLPPKKVEVAVLVILSDGSFKHDIGLYYGPHGEGEGWYCQFWNDKPRVAAWYPLPSPAQKEVE